MGRTERYLGRTSGWAESVTPSGWAGGLWPARDLPGEGCHPRGSLLLMTDVQEVPGAAAGPSGAPHPAPDLGMCLLLAFPTLGAAPGCGLETAGGAGTIWIND